MGWDGVERRHNLEGCLQEKRFEKIELVTDGTVSQLAQMNLTMVELKTLLSGKVGIYDKHVEDGERWRTDIFKMLIAACTAGMASTVGFGIWVGALSNQIKVNTERITVMESSIQSQHFKGTSHE